MSETYDVIVIGGGPGGYVCAIRAAQLGLKAACVEKRATLGGTCLNIGCIPSKALLQSSENFAEARDHFAEHGVMLESVKLDLARMQARKDEVVGANVKGVEFLFKKNKVDWLKGTGTITAPGQVSVDGKVYAAKSIVLATGSESIPLPGVDVDEKRVVSSTGALELDQVPDKLVVIGGGYIGLELGSVWRRLGADVTVVEYLDRLVPGMDAEIAKTFERVLGKQGVKFRLGTKVTSADTSGNRVQLTVEPAKGGTPETIEADCRPGRDRAAGVHRPARFGRAGRQARRPGPGRGRCALCEQRGRHLRDRRRDQRADARPQGRGRGRGAGRAVGGAGRARELRGHPWGRVHLAGGCEHRVDRRPAQAAGHRLCRRQISIHRERPGAGDGQHGWLRENLGRQRRATRCSEPTSSGRMPGR